MVSQHDELTAVEAAVTACGLRLVSVADHDAVVDAVLREVPAILLFDLLPSTFDLVRRLRGMAPAARLPVILLTQGGSPDAQGLAELNVADFLAGPTRPEELALRVSAVLARSRHREQQNRIARNLREQSRRVSVAIRSTNEPQEMAALTVAGLGKTFGVDHVWLRTFHDERGPSISASWTREGKSALPDPALTERQSRALCAQLWADESVLAVPDHAADVSPLGRSSRRPAGERGLTASVVVPLGQGTTAFGSIWLAQENAARLWAPVELSLLQHVAGNLAYGLIQGHLITEQRQVLSSLRELDRAKTEFLANVNHELRTPLTSIIGYLDKISDGAVGELPPAASDVLKVVERNAQRLNHLIEDLLTLSRNDARQIAQSIQPVRIKEVLYDAAAAAAPLAAKRDVTLELSGADTRLVVEGDRDQLDRIFINIVSNAVKFSRAGGTVSVQADFDVADAGSLRAYVRVTDTGIGIPENEIPKLFNRFYRGSNATAAAIPGTGLGLAIVQDLVHQNAGELSIESRLGAGTTVTVQLPVPATI